MDRSIVFLLLLLHVYLQDAVRVIEKCFQGSFISLYVEFMENSNGNLNIFMQMKSFMNSES